METTYSESHSSIPGTNELNHINMIHKNSEAPVDHTGTICHDDVIKWKHFPRYCPFVPGIHRSPLNSPRKGQWRGALMFCLIRAWINSWVNNCEAGDLRRYLAHCDVIVMVAEILRSILELKTNEYTTSFGTHFAVRINKTWLLLDFSCGNDEITELVFITQIIQMIQLLIMEWNGVHKVSGLMISIRHQLSCKWVIINWSIL